MLARHRISAIDVLRMDYEYCNISRYDKGAEDILGNPARNLILTYTNIKCRIDPLTALPSIAELSYLGFITPQGIMNDSFYLMDVNIGTDILKLDVVTDYDNLSYEVVKVDNVHTHIEVVLRKL